MTAFPPPRVPMAEYLWRRCEPWFAAVLAYDHRGISLESVKADYHRKRYSFLAGARAALLIEPIRCRCGQTTSQTRLWAWSGDSKVDAGVFCASCLPAELGSILRKIE